MELLWAVDGIFCGGGVVMFWVSFWMGWWDFEWVVENLRLEFLVGLWIDHVARNPVKMRVFWLKYTPIMHVLICIRVCFNSIAGRA